MFGIISNDVPRRAEQKWRRVFKRVVKLTIWGVAGFILCLTAYFSIAVYVACKAQTTKDCYPAHLEGVVQGDYRFREFRFAGIHRTERKKVIFCLVEPPRQDFGNQVSAPWLAKYLGPIPVPRPSDRWQWQISHTTAHEQSSFPLGYFAITAPRGWMRPTHRGAWHARIGFRWDDMDGYYVFSIAFKWIDDAPLTAVSPHRRAIHNLPPAYLEYLE